MKAILAAGAARGSVAAPTSKSMAHRLLICAGLAEGTSVINGVSDCEDVQATLDCLRMLGVACVQNGDTVTVEGVRLRGAAPRGALNCRESGSTLRFLIPVLLASGAQASFTGYGRLMERPMQVYESICRDRGLLWQKDGASLTVGGGLPSGQYCLRGDVSSQFVSGLLFALSLVDGDSEIELLPPVESRSYMDLTLDALQQFGVTAEWCGEARIRIKGGQRYQPRRLTVEGDYSNAAFLEALGYLGGEVRVAGLRADSLQGDRCYREMLQALHSGRAELSLADCPDLGPILFAFAAAKHGGVFTNTRRLRIKESDRIAAMRAELAKLGGTVLVEEDRVEVLPAKLTAPKQPICAHNDHRIAMAMAVLLTVTGGEIEGAEAVRKSYPHFFEDLGRLGISVTLTEA